MIHGLKVYENAGRVVGNRYSEKDTYFTDEGFKLVSGNPITPDAKQVALVHEDFANANGLNIGDYIILKNVEGKEVEEKVKIIGIFTSTRKSDSEFMDGPSNRHPRYTAQSTAAAYPKLRAYRRHEIEPRESPQDDMRMYTVVSDFAQSNR